MFLTPWPYASGKCTPVSHPPCQAKSTSISGITLPELKNNRGSTAELFCQILWGLGLQGPVECSSFSLPAKVRTSPRFYLRKRGDICVLHGDITTRERPCHCLPSVPMSPTPTSSSTVAGWPGSFCHHRQARVLVEKDE